MLPSPWAMTRSTSEGSTPARPRASSMAKPMALGVGPEKPSPGSQEEPYPATEARQVAPRPTAEESSSSAIVPQPSPRRDPLLSRSKGRQAEPASEPAVL